MIPGEHTRAVSYTHLDVYKRQELLKSGLVDNFLLCELAVHPDFPRLMADLEIYANGTAVKQVQLSLIHI